MLGPLSHPFLMETLPMRRCLPFVGAAAMALAVAAPSPVHAQEMPEAGQLVQVQWMIVPPARMDAFMGTIAQINEAAAEAELPEEFSWNVWTSGTQVVLALPMVSMATMDDPMYFLKHFAGKPAMEKLQSAFNALGTEAGARPGMMEIWEALPSWAHEGNGHETNFAHQFDMWIAAGKEEEFDAVAKDIVAFMDRNETPWEIQGFRVRAGDVGRAVFLVFNDDLGAFYGDQSLEAYLATSDAAPEWQEIMGRFMETIVASEERQWTRVQELSFPGTEGM